jgi:Skp family chaperone for outer membrane proteins
MLPPTTPAALPESAMRIIILPALCLLSALCCPRAAAADVPAQAEAPRIAVLRLQDTLLGFKMYADGLAKLKQEHAERQAKLNALEERMKDLDGKMQVLDKDGDAFASAQLELKSLDLEDKMSADRGTRVLADESATLLKESFATMRGILRSFCQDHGIKLVHLAPNSDIQSADYREVDQALLTQTVLYFDPALDITDAFIPYLNQRWADQLAKASVAPPAPKAPDAAPAPPAPAR